MPFNLSQIFGGWRRKEKKTQKPRGKASENSLTLPASSAGRQGWDSGARPRLEFSSASPRGSSDIAPRVASVKNKSELAWKLIVAPHISEKSAMLGDGKYVFKVAGSANKPYLKQAIEARYGVLVESINILAPRDKKRRRGTTLGIKQGFKKAVVVLKEGQNITEF